MSLDIYLVRQRLISYDNGLTHHSDNECVYETNITHNLGEMADAAGIYKALWRPEEECAEYAFQIIPNLEMGLDELKSRPEYFAQFNALNGWGMYEHFVPFVEDYLKACKEFPYAKIEVLR